MSDSLSSLIADHEKTLTRVSIKAVGVQFGLMAGISILTVVAFSFFRPREKKVYAPKIKYQLPKPSDPLDDPDYEPPPPPISNGFFAWISPLLHMHEEELITNIGMDASTFLRFLRLLRNAFTVITVLVVGLLVVDIVYNLKYVPSTNRNALSILTIQNVSGSWMWPALAVSYIINFVVMFFIWRNWQTMVVLRRNWFRSPAYQTKIHSRTLMITRVAREYRSDEGLVRLMALLKVDGIKIGPEIEATSIGRRLQDFPQTVEDHNQAVADLEKHLVKYLKGGKLGNKRPTLRVGGFLGFGGEKKDAIDHLANKIKSLRDQIDTKRQTIDSLIRQERKAKKGGRQSRVEGENYGFVTFKSIAEAHRIARTHQGPQKELLGAQITLAPMPVDIVWQNISRDPAELRSRSMFGFFVIGCVCFFYTVPLLIISLLANLSSLTLYVPFLESWKDAGEFGNWTFSIVSGTLPSILSVFFGFFLPIIMRKISKYQGAYTRSRLDRAVTARYYFFIIISNVVIFSLLSTVYNAVAAVVLQIGQHKNAGAILSGLKDIPDKIQGAYVQQSTYWFTWLPLRGFLVFFELIQLIKLAMVSVRRLMFSYTPRDIREMTKPGYFDYPVVTVNLLFVATVGMIYAPLAPIVAMGACTIFWFSSLVYKYQLLYVYISRAESGGRMWNVYCNRLIAACILMQLLMILTTALIRSRWIDSVAGVPPIIIMAAFKIYIDKTAGKQFKYYNPSSADSEFHHGKRIKQSDMDRRFLHPALLADKLYTVMVHKSQEEFARDVLADYPWFMSGNKAIKAVREENLEYDAEKDRHGGGDDTPLVDSDARSIFSDTTTAFGGKAEFNGHEAMPHFVSTHPVGFGSVTSFDNGSTEQLDFPPTNYPPTRRQASGGGGGGFSYHPASSTDSISRAPLLAHAQERGVSDMAYPPGDVPYPPSAYSQPPVGMATAPTMRRTATGTSDDSQYLTRWDGASDVGSRSNGPPSYTTNANFANHSDDSIGISDRNNSNNARYNDPYADLGREPFSHSTMYSQPGRR